MNYEEQNPDQDLEGVKNRDRIRRKIGKDTLFTNYTEQIQCITCATYTITFAYNQLGRLFKT
jgi:hypothetical protein